MVTIAVDRLLPVAQQIRDTLIGIDTEGTHFAVDDPKEVLGLIETNEPDVIFLEVDLPAMSGFDLALNIRQTFPDVNIVFVTDHPEYAVEAFRLRASGFVLKPVSEEILREEIANLRRPPKHTSETLLRVQCFGNFEAFGNNGIIKFSRSLSKEALAYLIDRRGAECTVGEICSVLWEDRRADKQLKSQCRVIMSSLKRDLAKAGAEDAIIKDWNEWAIDTGKVSCDYYDFLRNDSTAVRSFRGEYMSQYSWAEMTTGVLYDIEESKT